MNVGTNQPIGSNSSSPEAQNAPLAGSMHFTKVSLLTESKLPSFDQLKPSSLITQPNEIETAQEDLVEDLHELEESGLIEEEQQGLDGSRFSMSSLPPSAEKVDDLDLFEASYFEEENDELLEEESETLSVMQEEVALEKENLTAVRSKDEEKESVISKERVVAQEKIDVVDESSTVSKQKLQVTEHKVVVSSESKVSEVMISNADSEVIVGIKEQFRKITDKNHLKCTNYKFVEDLAEKLVISKGPRQISDKAADYSDVLDELLRIAVQENILTREDGSPLTEEDIKQFKEDFIKGFADYYNSLPSTQAQVTKEPKQTENRELSKGSEKGIVKEERVQEFRKQAPFEDGHVRTAGNASTVSVMILLKMSEDARAREKRADERKENENSELQDRIKREAIAKGNLNRVILKGEINSAEFKQSLNKYLSESQNMLVKITRVARRLNNNGKRSDETESVSLRLPGVHKMGPIAASSA